MLVRSFDLGGGDRDGHRVAARLFLLPAGAVHVSVYARPSWESFDVTYALAVTARPVATGAVESKVNGSVLTADILPVGTTVRGSSAGTTSVDRDVYVTTLPAAGRVGLALSSRDAARGEAHTVRVLDAHGVLLREVRLGDAGAALPTVADGSLVVPAGRVYVEVVEAASSALWATSYHLTVTFEGRLTARTPRISGTVKVGRRPSAVPGAWTSGASLRYQWFRSGAAIKGATARTYKVTKADAGHRITGSKAGFAPASRSSAAKVVPQYVAKDRASKASVKRGARAKVTSSATARPTGKVTVRVAGKKVTAKVVAKGKVKVTLPKISKRGAYKVTVGFAPSGPTKVSTKGRTVTTTLRVR